MIEPEETKLAVNAILISPHNEFILQERDNIPGILSPGMWSLFGGTLKANETKWSGLRRELFEELEYTYLGAQVEVFKTYKLTLEKDGRDKEISIYIIRDVDIRKLVLHEGKDIIIDKLDELLSHEDKISPVSLRILKDFKEQYKL